MQTPNQNKHDNGDQLYPENKKNCHSKGEFISKDNSDCFKTGVNQVNNLYPVKSYRLISQTINGPFYNKLINESCMSGANQNSLNNVYIRFSLNDLKFIENHCLPLVCTYDLNTHTTQWYPQAGYRNDKSIPGVKYQTNKQSFKDSDCKDQKGLGSVKDQTNKEPFKDSGYRNDKSIPGHRYKEK
ncbi:hypothetical protein [Myroides sp. LJL110]